MTATLHEATDADLPAVRNLVPCYLHDLSEHMGWACGADGRLEGCEDLESYWGTPGRRAFVLREGRALAGFVLILAEGGEAGVDFSITDFFVLREFRGRGVGRRAAHALFDRFPGRWKVEQFADNRPAVAFWRKVVERYCGGRFGERPGELQGRALNVLVFRSDGVGR